MAEHIDECCICLEPTNKKNENFELFCGHKFHIQCIESWTFNDVHMRKRKKVTDCPVCRHQINPDDIHKITDLQGIWIDIDLVNDLIPDLPPQINGYSLFLRVAMRHHKISEMPKRFQYCGQLWGKIGQIAQKMWENKANQIQNRKTHQDIILPHNLTCLKFKNTSYKLTNLPKKLYNLNFAGKSM